MRPQTVATPLCRLTQLGLGAHLPAISKPFRCGATLLGLFWVVVRFVAHLSDAPPLWRDLIREVSSSAQGI